MKRRTRTPPSWLPTPLRDRRVADRFEQLASDLDAGLAVDALLPGDRRATFVERLVDAVPLAPAERKQLEAAERSGRLADSLRARAIARRQRADVAITVLRPLPYFLLLIVLGVMVAFVTATLVRQPRWLALTAFGGALAVLPLLALWIRLRIRDPGFTGGGIPGLAVLLQDFADTAYLEAVGGLYGAGVALPAAHAAAIDAVPVAASRARLRRAQSLLDDGHGFSEALAAAAAVDAQTLQILTAAERAGDLEAAFARALARRHTMLDRHLRWATRIALVFLQVAVYGFAAWQILSFYSEYYGRLR
jgi:type II secretory pathway component PulF